MDRASHPMSHLPWFIPEQGRTDVLLVATGIFLVFCIVLVGVLLLRIHQLPMQFAATEEKIQYQVVCVLCLLSLITQSLLLWVAALLLAMIDIPDFTRPFAQIASALKRIAAGR